MEPNEIDLLYPTADQVAQINEELVGSRQVRSRDLLESATGQPHQTFGGDDLFPTPFDKAAALIRSIAENQPFVDGNKRTAWIAGRVLLRANGIGVKASTEEIVELMLRLARKDATVDDIATFLLEHSAGEPEIG